MSKPLVVWTIAGFDPSSGAGITADLKTISSHDCYGVACITALTVQSTLGVRRVEPIAPQTVHEMLQVLLDDFPPNAIKIGMLATSDIVNVVADFLEALHRPGCPVVLDPILRSSSGAELLDHAGCRLLLTRLLPLATVVTPNRSEAALLTGLAGDDAEAMASSLRQLGAAAAVVTGGDPGAGQHSQGNEQRSEDVLAYEAGGMEFVETLSAPLIRSNATHGTGCAFSTAIACELAHGRNVPTAVTSAKTFVRRAIERAPGLGAGYGPMGLDRFPPE
ncbi:MAG: bifunctional hydroxymethylpyrimidine kinase/phosphomethylpyrimidine kinase [Candidatus Korobacteraceae bacterium]|jgi:hydroxymethylpyrimidine/phosphomethylpyrimidine kinase